MVDTMMKTRPGAFVTAGALGCVSAVWLALTVKDYLMTPYVAPLAGGGCTCICLSLSLGRIWVQCIPIGVRSYVGQLAAFTATFDGKSRPSRFDVALAPGFDVALAPLASQ